MRPVVLAALLSLTAAAPAHADVPTGNLLKNPDADAPIVDPDGAPVPEWTVADPTQAAEQPYGADGYPSAAVATSISGGGCFFYGGPADDVQTFSQDVDVSSSAQEIDAGTPKLLFGGYFGGSDASPDAASLAVQPVDGNGANLGDPFTVGPVTPADRGNQTTLLWRDSTATLPAGTRRLHVTLTSTALDGGSNDGFADNVFLTFDQSYTVAAQSRRCAGADAPPPPVITPPAPFPMIVQPPDDTRTFDDPTSTSTTSKSPSKPGNRKTVESLLRLPSSASCRRTTGLAVHFTQPRRIRSLVINVNGHRVRKLVGHPDHLVIRLKRGLTQVELSVLTTGGKRLTAARSYRTC